MYEPSESIDSAWAALIARSRRSSSMVNCQASLWSTEPLSLRPLTCIAVSLAHGSTCEPAIYLGPSSPQVLRTSIAPRTSLHPRASAVPSRPLLASRFSDPKVRPDPVFGASPDIGREAPADYLNNSMPRFPVASRKSVLNTKVTGRTRMMNPRKPPIAEPTPDIPPFPYPIRPAIKVPPRT